MDAVVNWDKVLMAFAAALALGVSALATAWVRETGDLKEGIRAFFEKRPPRF